ncbi:hypothetical protein FKW15_12125 [Acetobacter sp. DmW_125133]|nr:hypothetical protein DS739_02895 [Acetobacter sp. JWB]KAA8398623.1 hypothetical protein FKW20_06625 [Acetobacter sp. DmW_125127]KAA8399157.1 hypothetical protein FKW19_03515 [Acetobacter sp. DmW_125128]KAA8401020.1 hypothetical protein FKW22_00150 [Acetobacter sp. DmW_125124]KAA8402723.1 hypothetical protein FKW15_12125 [Acetobacter sp. DmW_125133]KAA8406523.1 hypothetical protein FKW32_04315 [Acetobacter sp. DmW_125132]KAA8409864.1 hypothetical protein FKW24_01770 [Acetobacter sp. DmW_125
MVRIVSWLLLWCQREVCTKFATPYGPSTCTGHTVWGRDSVTRFLRADLAQGRAYLWAAPSTPRTMHQYCA